MLENSRHTVRLPTLPRQVIFLAIGLDGHGTQFQITLPHQTPGAPRDDTVDDDAVLGLTDESTTASVA